MSILTSGHFTVPVPKVMGAAAPEILAGENQQDNNCNFPA
jgi:hypothetical protein